MCLWVNEWKDSFFGCERRTSTCVSYCWEITTNVLQVTNWHTFPTGNTLLNIRKLNCGGEFLGKLFGFQGTQQRHGYKGNTFECVFRFSSLVLKGNSTARLTRLYCWTCICRRVSLRCHLQFSLQYIWLHQVFLAFQSVGIVII